MINKLAKEVHENAKAKGFYEEEKNIGEMLMLIVSEVAEACEADRDGSYADIDTIFDPKISVTSREDIDRYLTTDDLVSFEKYFKLDVKNTVEDELADIMIRVMDFAAYKGIDLEWHVKAKMKYNSLREYKHGKKY